MNEFRKTISRIYRRTGHVRHVFELASHSLLEHEGDQLLILDWPVMSSGGPNRYKTFIRSLQLKTVVEGLASDAPPPPVQPPGAYAAGRPPAPPTTEVVFSTETDELRAILKQMPIRTMAHAEQEWEAYKRDYQCVFGVLQKGETLQLEFVLDTDSSGFLHWTHPNPQRRVGFQGFQNREAFEVVLQARIYSPSEVAKWGEQRGQVRIRLEPCGELDKFAGFVAIDFGNNSSTIACLPGHRFSANDVRLVNADPKVSQPGLQPSLESKLRVTSYDLPVDPTDPDNSRGAFGRAEVFTGTDAIRTHSVRGVLLDGLKPLLADPNEEPPLQLELETGQRSLRKSDAGELFLAELFKAFHREQLARAIPVTLTYPTTYSLGEITRLKSAVTRAFHRAMLMPGLPPAKVWDEMPKIIGEQIDEATAAAFFYLYRDFIDGPGQTAAFKYLYPQGLNLLLYDCGGGTTDIALVHAFPKQIKRTDVDGRVRETWQVKLSLLGRTGHRRFGGDNITAAMAVAIKWLMAHKIDPSIPAPTADLPESQRTQLLVQINQILPTAWRCPATGAELHTEPSKIRACKIASRELVRFAEEVKIELSQSVDSQQDEPIKADLPGNSLLAKMIKHACAQGTQRGPKVQEVLTQIRSNLRSLLPVVNQMISDDVDLTVTAANNLIRDRLVAPTSTTDCPIDPEATQPYSGHPQDNGSHPGNSHPGPDHPADTASADTSDAPHLAADACIHWVYVVGKASQYPLILERLRAQLNVADLQPASEQQPRDCRLVLEKEMLKGAVARGAVLARMFSKKVTDVEIVYDRKMPLKLPFEMSIRSPSRGMRPMFQPDQFYHHLEPYEYDAADREPDDEYQMGPSDHGQKLTVYRRWPGMAGSGENDGWEDYLLFEFPEDVQGTITIGYEPLYEGSHEYGFVATSEHPHHRALGIDASQEMFRSPLQRGQL